jgi:hypothetical protein
MHAVLLGNFIDRLRPSNRFQGNLGFLRTGKYLPFAFAHFLPIIFRQGIA